MDSDWDLTADQLKVTQNIRVERNTFGFQGDCMIKARLCSRYDLSPIWRSSAVIDGSGRSHAVASLKLYS